MPDAREEDLDAMSIAATAMVLGWGLKETVEELESHGMSVDDAIEMVRRAACSHEQVLAQDNLFQTGATHREKYLCSDPQCPCPGTEALTPGETGYLYTSEDVVRFREDARSYLSLEFKIHLIQAGGEPIDPIRLNPILMCERGARLRSLDLDAAREDAAAWIEKDLLPLRATPLK